MDYKIRRRRQNDCYDVAHVVTVSWNETYKGIVPDWFLEELKNTEKERGQKSFDEFDINNNNQFVLEVDNKVVGFVNFGVSLDETFTNCGEIFALYIISKYKGFGFGKMLVERAVKEIKMLNCDKMIISCLKGNPSNEFYKHIGGVHIKNRIFKRLNLPENIYYFEKI